MERISPLDVAESLQSEPASFTSAPEAQLIEELYFSSGAMQLGWTLDQFAGMLASAAARSPDRPEAYLRSLHIRELTLAQACARGYDAAWNQFIETYRTPLKQAAIAISKSSSIGEELADSLYAELFGLKAHDGQRRSPLASYSGRGSLMGWLRATLAQRYVDRFRRTYCEAPLEDIDFAAPAESSPTPEDANLVRLESTIQTSLCALGSEDRFLLVSYFLDGRTLLEIARVLRVHEATVSRRLNRLTRSIRKQLLRELQRGGLKRAAAEEALAVDPRDLNINLRKILQTATNSAFPDKDEHKP